MQYNDIKEELNKTNTIEEWIHRKDMMYETDNYLFFNNLIR